MKIQHVIIVGGGPAGLSAAIYAARAGLKPLLFAGSPPGGQLMLTSEVENFPGYEEIMGPELVQTLRKQAERFHTTIIDDNIKEIHKQTSSFIIKTAKTQYKTIALIIATGAKALWLGLESETRLRGKGVSACATCDGFFFKEKVVAVVGGGDTAMEEAQTLTKFAKKVYLIHRKDTFRASKIMQKRVLNNPKIEIIWSSTVQEVLGNHKVEGLQIATQEKSSQLAVDGLFIAIGHKPDTEICKDIVLTDKKGYIMTSASAAVAQFQLEKFNMKFQTMTSSPGIFAAGDCVDHIYRQAGTAAGMGIAAALDAERWIEQNQ